VLWSRIYRTGANLGAFTLFGSAVFAQGGSAPAIREDLMYDMPALNGVPGKDDPALRTDADVPACACAEESPSTAAPNSGLFDDDDDTGDPVGLHNGMVSLRRTDLVVPGRGIDFEFTRRYNSKRSGTDGPLGCGWDFSYDIRLEYSAYNRILWNGNNRLDKYTDPGPTGITYLAPKGVFTVLTGDGGGHYVLRARHGSRTTFVETLVNSHLYARLDRMEDHNGNFLQFNYDSGAAPCPGNLLRLTSVTDTLGRTISFTYTSASRISKVTDFAGREIKFTYDSSGNLVTARSPSILYPFDGHRAIDGRLERYRYYAGTLGDALDHNLTAVVRPNEGQGNVNGTPYVQFVYDQTPGSWSYDWCIKQTLGANGVGGDIFYSYSALNPNTGGNDATIARLLTTVVDRKAHTTKYQFNENGNPLSIEEVISPSESATTHITYDGIVDSEGLIKSITFPRGNTETRNYDTPLCRWSAGNVLNITYGTGGIASDQTTRVVSFVWEPVFNHLYQRTDERGQTTQYFWDWMEGNATSGNASYVLDDIAAKLGISETDAGTLAASFLQNTDLNGDGQHTDVRGNLVQRREPEATLSTLGTGSSKGQIAHEPDGTQQAITSLTYNQFGQRTSTTNAEQNVTVYLYYPELDADGIDGVSPTVSGRDSVTGGYMRRTVEDTSLPYSDGQLSGVSTRSVSSDFARDSGFAPTPTQKTTDFEYGPIPGYTSAVTDPRGIRTTYDRDNLGEIYLVTRAQSVAGVSARLGGCDPATPEDLTGQGYAYAEWRCFDYNGNLGERYVQNTGNLPDAGDTSGWLETYYYYDILNNLISKDSEYGQAGEMATWQYTYDANDNLADTTLPEGEQTHNDYDSLDRLWKVTRAPGHTYAITDERLYDANGNLTRFTDGHGEHVDYVYDGFDRMREKVAPDGTHTTWTYDAGSNPTIVRVNGAPAPGQAAIELTHTEISYDQRSRATRIDRCTPDGNLDKLNDGILTPNDGNVTTRLDYDRLGRRTFVFEDDAQAYETRYDGGNRPTLSLDPLNNTTQILWDDNNNPVKIVESDVYPNSTTRTFETYQVFDSLNRRAALVNNLGETERFSYDSRDNLVSYSDANGTMTSQVINGHAVNGPGKSRHFSHDGFGRLVSEVLDGGSDCANSSNTDGKVTLLQAWDRDSQLISRTDDNGHVTHYVFDKLGRQVAETLADGSSYTLTYRTDDLVAEAWDPNGTKTQFSYDAAGRMVGAHAYQLGTGVVGTTDLAFEYDGVGRRTKTRDSVDAALDGNDWIVTRAYDPLGRVTTETQNGRTITNAWKEEGKRTSITYPSGLRINTSYDALDRVASITEGTGSTPPLIASYAYAGRNRVLERLNGNSTSTRYYTGAYNDTAYYDGVRRPTRVDHVNASNVLLTGFEHTYDRAGNRKFERRLHDSSKGDNYVYDSLYRLVTFEREVPAVDVGVLAQSHQQVKIDWQIDGAQNWRTLVTNGFTLSTSVNSVNEYTAFGGTTPSYDANGNMTNAADSPTQPAILAYDFLNRLRTVSKSGLGQSLSHTYDAEGRRVRTTSSGLSSLPAVSEFVFDGAEEIEEWATTGATLAVQRRYVMGRALDEPVRLESFGFYPNSGTYYYEQSTLGNVAALTDSTGAVVERYTYDAYGMPQFETAANVAKSVLRSDYGNPYLFNARRYEADIYSLYGYRSRVYDPQHGRFLQRDSIGTWGDAFSLGNALPFGANNTINHTDPFGKDVTVATIVLGGFFLILGMLVVEATCPPPELPKLGIPDFKIPEFPKFHWPEFGDPETEPEGGPESEPPESDPPSEPAPKPTPKPTKPTAPRSGDSPFSTGGESILPPIPLPTTAPTTQPSTQPASEPKPTTGSKRKGGNGNRKCCGTWRLGGNHSAHQWRNDFARGFWTEDLIDDAICSGVALGGYVVYWNGHPATRYVSPETGNSVIVDDETCEVIHAGGPNFKY
jgi:RHS repeat-associated protein